MYRVCFICYGSPYRAVLAEFVMNALLSGTGREDCIGTASAVIERTDGVFLASVHNGQRWVPGIIQPDIPVQEIVYDEYAYLIVFDQESYEALRRLCGSRNAHKVHRLLEFAGLQRDVTDPWYTGNFDQTYADVDLGCQALLQYIVQQNE